MSFLNHFDPAERERFEAAAQSLVLERGAYLCRRGEASGDIFLLQDGRLEVVDSRATPEVILAVLEPEAMVGELAFVDGSPRSADVRAASHVEVLQWPRQDLVTLLKRDAPLAAKFYEAIARTASARMRRLTATAMAGAVGSAKSQGGGLVTRAREDARALSESVKEGLLELETRLRADPGDHESQSKLQHLLNDLRDQITVLFQAHPDPQAAEAAATVLGRQLHPYLVRSSLAERCIRRPQGVTATAEILAHVLVNTPGGDGQIGELFDRWFLGMPTMEALRAFRQPIVGLAADKLPTHRNRRVLLLNAGTGSLVAGLMETLHTPPTQLTVIDQSREALAFLDGSIVARPGVELITAQENLAQFAMGRRRRNLVQQDVVIVHGLTEYLPDRLVVSLLRTVGRLVVTGGTVVITGLAPSPDQVLLDRLLAWPTVRRSRELFQQLVEAAWIDIGGDVDVGPAGFLYYGTPDPVMTARSSYTPAVAPRRSVP